ncbi:MAG: AbiU2 domain-containing protein [Kiloniellales bacterium]
MSKRKLATLTCAEAVERLDNMVELVADDLKMVLWTEAVLESANDIIRSSPNRKFPGAPAYEVIANSLAINLTISLARLFDPGSKRFKDNKKDIASIPLLIKLLKQVRIKRHLVSRARNWTPHASGFAAIHQRGCERAISNALLEFRSISTDASTRASIHKLREFRHERLAHSLMREKLSKITYAELFMLTDKARNVVQQVVIAVIGDGTEFLDTEKSYRSAANQFWDMALKSGRS